METTGDDQIVQSITESPLFRKAPAARELLLFLWKQRDTPLTEYGIGVDALGRRPEFDPKTDATVRVQVSRLRQRLKDYYAGEGQSATRRLHLPAGSYRLELTREEAPPVEPVVTPRRSWLPALGVGMAALVVDNIRLRWAAATRTPALHPFLALLVQPGRAVHLVVPVPLFFRWSDQSLVARDFRVNTTDKLPQSPALRQMAEEYGAPETTQLYTVASDTLAASALSRYLEERGVPATVIDSPAATVELLATRDTAVFVGPGTSAQLAELIANANFHFRPGTSLLYNRNPLEGEPASFPFTQHSPVHATGHAAFARLPGRTANTQLLVFASSHNPALVALLTTPSELDSLAQLHQKNGAPPFFEIVIRYERNGDRILRLQAVLFRTVAVSR